MARATNAPASRARRKKWLKLAKGYYGGRSKLYRVARTAVMKALAHAYRHRKEKKRNMRRLAILKINAAVREAGLSYSEFMYGMKKLGIGLNRQVLAKLAQEDKPSFFELVNKIKSELRKEK